MGLISYLKGKLKKWTIKEKKVKKESQFDFKMFKKLISKRDNVPIEKVNAKYVREQMSKIPPPVPLCDARCKGLKYMSKEDFEKERIEAENFLKQY